MKKRLIYISLFWFLLGCDPIEVPKPQNPTPVFETTMKINGRDISLTVGKDSIVNTPTYAIQSGHRLEYLSAIEKEGCTQGCERFLFSFVGDTHYDKGTYNFEDAFHKGEWDYRWTYNKNRYQLEIKVSGASKYSYMERWMIGDRVIKNWQTIEDHTSRRVVLELGDLSSGGSFELCRHIRRKNKPVLVQLASCKTISWEDLNKDLSKDSLQVSIVIFKVLRNNNYKLKAVPHGIKDQRNLKYVWSNSREGKPSIKVNGLTGKKFRVEVTDKSTQHTAIAYLRADAEVSKGELSRLPVATTYWIKAFSRGKNKDSEQLGRVVLNYVSSDGVKYSSSVYQQPEGSYFRVKSIGDFVDESNQKEYKKLKVEFAGTLYSRQGSIEVKEGNATIALDYPR